VPPGKLAALHAFLSIGAWRRCGRGCHPCMLVDARGHHRKHRFCAQHRRREACWERLKVLLLLLLPRRLFRLKLAACCRRACASGIGGRGRCRLLLSGGPASREAGQVVRPACNRLAPTAAVQERKCVRARVWSHVNVCAGGGGGRRRRCATLTLAAAAQQGTHRSSSAPMAPRSAHSKLSSGWPRL
jgi:hypothetical protein